MRALLVAVTRKPDTPRSQCVLQQETSGQGVATLCGSGSQQSVRLSVRGMGAWSCTMLTCPDGGSWPVASATLSNRLSGSAVDSPQLGDSSARNGADERSTVPALFSRPATRVRDCSGMVKLGVRQAAATHGRPTAAGLVAHLTRMSFSVGTGPSGNPVTSKDAGPAGRLVNARRGLPLAVTLQGSNATQHWKSPELNSTRPMRNALGKGAHTGGRGSWPRASPVSDGAVAAPLPGRWSFQTTRMLRDAVPAVVDAESLPHPPVASAPSRKADRMTRLIGLRSSARRRSDCRAWLTADPTRSAPEMSQRRSCLSASQSPR